MYTIKEICEKNYAEKISIINTDHLIQLSSIMKFKVSKYNLMIKFKRDITLKSIIVITANNGEEFNIYIPELALGDKKIYTYLYFYYKPTGIYGLSGLLNKNPRIKEALVTGLFEKYNIGERINKPYLLFTYKSLKIINGICHLNSKEINTKIKFDGAVDFLEKYKLYAVEAYYYTYKANPDTSFYMIDNSNDFYYNLGLITNTKYIDAADEILKSRDFTKLPSINITAKKRNHKDFYIRGYDYIISTKNLIK